MAMSNSHFGGCSQEISFNGNGSVRPQTWSKPTLHCCHYWSWSSGSLHRSKREFKQGRISSYGWWTHWQDTLPNSGHGGFTMFLVLLHPTTNAIYWHMATLSTHQCEENPQDGVTRIEIRGSQLLQGIHESFTHWDWSIGAHNESWQWRRVYWTHLQSLAVYK